MYGGRTMKRHANWTIRDKSKKTLLEDVKRLDHIPDGWRKIDGATTAPLGYTWYSNGKSRFTIPKVYDQALVKDSDYKEVFSRLQRE